MDVNLAKADQAVIVGCKSDFIWPILNAEYDKCIVFALKMFWNVLRVKKKEKKKRIFIESKVQYFQCWILK